MMAAVEGEVAKAICDGLLTTASVSPHRRRHCDHHDAHTGRRELRVHQLAWKAFPRGLPRLRKPPGFMARPGSSRRRTVRKRPRRRPGVAELSFDHSLSGTRPAESFMVSPRQMRSRRYNLPLYSPLRSHVLRRADAAPDDQGIPFHVIDMDNTAGDSVIELGRARGWLPHWPRCSATTSALA